MVDIGRWVRDELSRGDREPSESSRMEENGSSAFNSALPNTVQSLNRISNNNKNRKKLDAIKKENESNAKPAMAIRFEGINAHSVK
jgi:hypothetical protein